MEGQVRAVRGAPRRAQLREPPRRRGDLEPISKAGDRLPRVRVEVRGVQSSYRCEASRLPSRREVWKEHPGPGDPHEVPGEATPTEGVRGAGDPSRPPGDPGHCSGHYPKGERVAQARVRGHQGEDPEVEGGLH